MAKTKKAFSELSDAGKKRRLAKYEAERAERGTDQLLGRLVRPVSLRATSKGDGSQSAYFTVAVWNANENKTDFVNMSGYVKPGSDKLEAFYKGLTKGQLLSVEYKVVESDKIDKMTGEPKTFINAYSVMKREIKTA